MNERAAAKEIRAAVYARVSSERQADKDLSIPAQLKALRQYADKHGWRVVEQFVDEAESARTADRPEFQKMIAQAKQKQSPFTVILVWKLSRFARNREDSILYKAMLRKHGIQVVSINEPIDDSPAGRMLEGMIEVVDEFYSANLSVDTVRGMNENASRGFLNGGRAPYGYRRVKVKIGEAEKAKLEPEPAQAPIVKRVFQMCLDGMGVKEIAKRLNAHGYKTRDGNPWTNTVLYYMLTNEAYTGVTIFNGYRYWDTKGDRTQKAIRVEGTHPALVSKEEFERARQILKARSPLVTHPRTVSSEYLLSGLAYCGSCGAKMIGTTAKGGKFFYYGCQNYLKKGRESCKTGLINRVRLEEAVMDQLKDSVITDENLSALVNLVNEEVNRERRSVNERVEEIDAQLKSLNRRMDRLYSALETGHVEMADLGPRIRALREQIENTEERKREILATEAAPLRFSGAEVRRYVEDLRELMADGTLLERKSWLRTWVKRVSIDRKRGGTIEYQLPLAALKQESRPTVGGSLDAVLSTGQIGCPKPTISEPGCAVKTPLHCSVRQFCQVINNPNRMMLEPPKLENPKILEYRSMDKASNIAPLKVAFVGSDQGEWRVERIKAVRGDAVPQVSRIKVLEGPRAFDFPQGVWVLKGVTSSLRYTTRSEAGSLASKQAGLGRPEATHAALIPIKKSQRWWDMAQDERRAIFEEQSAHVSGTMKYLPAVARRLHHSRDLGEPFDFLTWFEFSPEHEPLFNELLVFLRGTKEWDYVEREVDIRLWRTAPTEWESIVRASAPSEK